MPEPRLSITERLLSFWRRRDADDELRFHLEMRVEEARRAGMTEEAARSAALERFGPYSRVQGELVRIDSARDRRHDRGEWLDDLRRDLVFAWRSLRRSPGVAVTLVATLAIGIAVVTTFFSFVNTILYRPHPYRYAERTVQLWTGDTPSEFIGELVRGSRAFERVGGSAWHGGVLETPHGFISGRGAVVDSGFFPMLAPRTILGRLPSSVDVALGAPVIVLGERLWRREYGGDTSVVGTTIGFRGQRREIVGVVDGNFTMPDNVDFWIPARGSGSDQVETLGWVFGRLAPGVTHEQAQAEVHLVYGRLHATDSVRYGRRGEPGVADMIVRTRGIGGRLPQVKVMGWASIVILLIASTNLALLMLARGARRHGEMVVRASLGASRWQLVRQLLVESALVAGVAGVIGTVLSVWGIRLLVAIIMSGRVVRQPGWIQWGVDWRVLAVGIAAALVAVVIFGVWPATIGTRIDLASVLKARGYAIAGDPTRNGHLPIVLQLVLSVVLFSTATTLAITYREIAGADRGFRPEGLYEASITLDVRDSAPVAQTAFLSRVRDEVNATPGAESSTIGYFASFNGESTDGAVYLPGATNPVVSAAGSRPDPVVVSSNYFHVLGLPIISGRAFDAGDAPGTMPVIIVSRSFADRAWHSLDVIGKTLVVGHSVKPRPGASTAGPVVVTVVGVAEDRRLLGRSGQGMAIVPRAESYVSDAQARLMTGRLMVRSTSPTSGVVSAALTGVDRQLPVDVVSADEQLARESAGTRMLAGVLSTFAAVGLGLALIGIYGVVSFGVEQRTREIGIRLALGASRHAVTGLVMSGGARLAATGIGVGLLAAVGVGRALSSFMMGTSGGQLIAPMLAGLAFSVVTLAASWIPARRAAALDPLAALRDG